MLSTSGLVFSITLCSLTHLSNIISSYFISLLVKLDFENRFENRHDGQYVFLSVDGTDFLSFNRLAGHTVVVVANVWT